MNYVFIGLSGSGKTVIATFFQGKNINLQVDKDLLDNHIILPKNVTSTTRMPRNGEIDGVDYNFLLKAIFLKKIENNEFAEYAEVFNDYYGLERKELEKYKHSIIVHDPQGAETLKKNSKNIVTIYFDVPPEISFKRMIERNDNSADIEKRMKKIQYFLEYKEKCDHIVNCDRNINLILREIEGIFKQYINLQS